MKQPLCEKKSERITDDEILSLYHQGYSANVISTTHRINPAYITQVLRASGLKPRDYKTCPDFIKTVLKELILAGFTYGKISENANIAYSYIREFVSQSDEIQELSTELLRRKANCAVPPTIPPVSVCSEQMISEFCKLYTNGEAGFCAIVTTLEATAEQTVYLFSIINKEMLKEHNQKLEAKILAAFHSGIPSIGIGKKLGVSPAYVTRIVKKHPKAEHIQ